MAFNNFLTPAWIAPGGNSEWWYTFYDNRGAQYATADVKTPGAKMWATAQGEQMETDGHITYFARFHNDGPNWCYYNLHGGGSV
jgi:hypothetical protein